MEEHNRFLVAIRILLHWGLGYGRVLITVDV